MKGKQGVGPGDDSTADNKGIYKEVRPVKLDFSATNFKATFTGWRLSIEKKADTLFPAVCDCARGIAGVAAAAATADIPEYQDPQILARANLASEEDTSTEEGVDKHRHHDNGIDDNHSGCENRGVNGSRDNGIGSSDSEEDDEDNDDGNRKGINGRPNGGGGSAGSDAEVSALTDFSSSDAKVVPDCG